MEEGQSWQEIKDKHIEKLYEIDRFLAQQVLNMQEYNDEEFRKIAGKGSNTWRDECLKMRTEMDFDETKTEVESLPTISEDDLSKMDIKPTVWLVDNLIPERAIVFLVGKSDSYKSLGVLELSLCISRGLLLFNKFSTVAGGVLYVDEENGLPMLKERLEKLKNGLGIVDSGNINFLSFENIKIDRLEWKERLEKTLEILQPKVVIVDSLRRIISFDENEARLTSELYTNVLKPLSEKYGVTWVLLHHMRKGISGRTSSNELDEVRGSSDFGNLADVVLLFNRPRGTIDRLVLKQVKCRGKRSIEPKLIQLVWNEDETSLKMEYVGDAEETIFADELCAKAIMSWVAEQQKASFETKEVFEVLKGQYAKATIHRALELLLNQNKIIRIKRGHYQLKTENLGEFSKKDDKND